MEYSRRRFFRLATGLLALPVAAASPETPLTFTRLWTHGHTTPGQVSEIPAFDAKTNTIWVAGVVGVDVLDGATGALIEHIDVTGSGFVNSVAIHDGFTIFIFGGLVTAAIAAIAAPLAWRAVKSAEKH